MPLKESSTLDRKSVSLNKGLDTLTGFSVQVTLLQPNGLQSLFSHTLISTIAILHLTILWSCSDPSQEMGPRTEPISSCPAPGSGISVSGLYGEHEDANPTTARTLVLMGGGKEDDQASELFLDSTNGGDIVILRASGSLTSYPNYFMSNLSPHIRPNSALTVLTSSPQNATDPTVSCWMNRAEGIWLAGGNQWDYLGGWPVEFKLFLGQLAGKNVSIGGTSAGAVSLGEAAFDAQHGTITSQEALTNPSNSKISISYPSFYQPELENILIDSHFSERNREGRLLAFLARFKLEKDRPTVLGVGLDEGVAVVIHADKFEIFAPLGRYAWIYEISGPVALTTGTPLNLTAIHRVKLADKDQGDWPIQVRSLEHEELVVIDGIVSKKGI